MKQYLTKQFLFDINRVMIEQVDKVFLVIGGIIFVIAVVLKLGAIFAPSAVDKKYRNKFYILFLTIGLSEIIWYGARTLYVKFFGSHFVAVLILLIGLVWFVWLVVNTIKNYSKEKTEWEREQVRLKYLPK